NIALRALDKDFSEVSNALSGLLRALPADDALRTTISINTQLNDLKAEKEQLGRDIREIDDKEDLESASEFVKGRKVSQQKLVKTKTKLRNIEESINKLELEMTEISDFQSYLLELGEKLGLAENTLELLGSIQFTHCPACGAKIDNNKNHECCALCNSPIDPDDERARYNQIRADLEIQSRESRQLIKQKSTELSDLNKQYRVLISSYESDVSEFEIKYSDANGPREAFLVEKTSRIGRINADIEYLTKSLTLASEVDELTQKKNSIQSDINTLKQRIQVLERSAGKRRSQALSEISDIAVSLLHADCKRQEEFEEAQTVSLSFVDDAISVDGKMSFAESSNVFLKNTAILSMFLAAGKDKQFFHPGFLLLDNIEDKGMEVERSHLFQRLIVEMSTNLEIPFQVIFTTSMMNPELELDNYVIGPSYTRDNKTLDFSSK